MRILVVDDDERVLQTICSLLTHAGFETTSVSSGCEALEAADQPGFDLILLDVVLPDLNGIEVCRQMKSRMKHFVPIILVTAEDSTEGKIDGLDSGADDYVSKPFDGRELLARVKALLRIKTLHDEVRRLAAVREQIVYTVTHDFRTPLVGIRGAIQNLLGGLVGPLTVDQREYLDLVDQATGRLSDLTDRMGRAARAERTDGKPPRSAVDLRKAAGTAAAGLRPEFVKRKIRFEMTSDPEQMCAWGDEESLVQVLANLLDNAVKHSPDGGRIRVEIDRLMDDLGPQAHIVVSDEGEGLARSDFERIFYRFEQVGPSSGFGIGLGLAICKEIIRDHGGKIWVESEPGKGARFHLKLAEAARVEETA